MLASARAGFLAALITLASFPAFSADKFHHDDLAQAAIRLEAQIKSEAGQIGKPVAAPRRDAETAFARGDGPSGMQALGQIVTLAPNEAANWLRLANAILKTRTPDARERTTLLERAGAAAYVAYQRAGNPNEEADSLVMLGRSLAERRLWRPALDALRLSLELREVADVRAQYERLRDEHGFRLLDYSVDADAASPRACFQFSEPLPKRADFSPFLAVANGAADSVVVRVQ